MNVCLICLRTDRLLKSGSTVLQEFHNEMCGYAVKATVPSAYYCPECQYLLEKFYKFKRKCVIAINVYRNWKCTEESLKLPMTQLYMLLPASPLGFWVSSSDKIANFTLVAMESESQYTLPDKVTKETTKENLVHDHNYGNCNTKNSSEPFLVINDDGNTEEHLLEYNLEEREDSNITEPKTSKETICRMRNHNFIRALKADKQYEADFDIEYLRTDEEKLAEFQRRKTYECYVNAAHKCEICYRGFKTLKFLQYHTEKWHVESAGKDLCPICKTWFPKQRKKHDHEHSIVFKCKRCPLITHSRSSMQNHYLWHKGKKYRCEECDLTYKSISVYNLHMAKNHRPRRHVCEACGRGFVSRLGLSVHKGSSVRCAGAAAAKEASNLPPDAAEGVRCDECDVTLSEQVYNAHMLDVHSTRWRSEIIAGRDGLPGRKIIKNGIETRSPYCRPTKALKQLCLLCNKVGPGFGWLRRHFRLEHPKEDINVLYLDKKKHLCDVCGAGFASSYGLRDHMNIHTGERPYACDLCPKRFRNTILRKEHRLRHFPSSFTCTLCGKRFKSNANLYVHMQTHAAEKSHMCSICGKAFLHNGTLKEHIQGVHYNIRRVRKRDTKGKLGNNKRTRVAEIEAIETSEVNETETIENCEGIETIKKYEDTQTIEQYEDIETIENSEDIETIDTSEVAETETIEKYEDTKTIEEYEDTETIEMYEEIETLDTSEVAETETIEKYEDTETIEEYEDTETIEMYEEIETLDTSEVAETETIEKYEDTETIEEYEDTETIEMYEEIETLDTSEVAETETIETSGVAETETIENNKLGETETIGMYEDQYTIETSEVAETETMSASAHTKKRPNRKRSSFQTYHPKRYKIIRFNTEDGVNEL